ncbi:MAG TPA: hypothetical protein VLJ59_13135 [Mycobacteriales bacterium]|nr:hypothetical protein [Mycobacteriales bacterium]
MGKHVHRPHHGRHCYGRPGLVHCSEIELVQGRLAALRPTLMALFRDQSRHTVATLTRSGDRPRLALVLIASM